MTDRINSIPLDDDGYRHDNIDCPYCSDQTELVELTIYDTVFYCTSCGETCIVDSL